MPTLRGFVTFINNPADLKEFFQAPESVLSLLGPLSEVSTARLFSSSQTYSRAQELQTDHTLPGALNRTTQSFLISLIRRVLDKSRIPYHALSEEIQLFLESTVEPTLNNGMYDRDPSIPHRPETQLNIPGYRVEQCPGV